MSRGTGFSGAEFSETWLPGTDGNHRIREQVQMKALFRGFGIVCLLAASQVSMVFAQQAVVPSGIAGS